MILNKLKPRILPSVSILTCYITFMFMQYEDIPKFPFKKPIKKSPLSSNHLIKKNDICKSILSDVWAKEDAEI